MTTEHSRSQLRRIAAQKGKPAPEFCKHGRNVYADDCYYCDRESVASPLDYPCIPDDLENRLREERRELVEAVTPAPEVIESARWWSLSANEVKPDSLERRKAFELFVNEILRIDAILAREEEKHE